MFDDILKEKANNHEAPVPPDAWDNIVKKKRRWRFIIFWWTSVLLLGGSATVFYLTNTGNPGATNAGEKNTLAIQPNTATKEITLSQQQHTGTTSLKHDDEKTATQDIAPSNNNTGSNLPTAKEKEQVDQPLIAGNIKTNKVPPANLVNNSAESKQVISDLKTKTALTPVVKKKTIKKINGRQTIKSIAADAGETAGDQQKKNTSADETDLAICQPAEKKEEINKPEQLSVKTDPILKDTVITTEQKKDTTGSREEKKENLSVNKKRKKKSWFLDASVMSVFPIQHYDESVSFNRTLSLNNDLTEFSGKAIKTTIAPAIAFSLAVRKTISSKLTVAIGLQYLQLRENSVISGKETNTKTSIIQQLVEGNNGPELVNDTIQSVTEGTRTITATNSYRIFSVPVFLQYNFIQNKSWSFGVVGGIYLTFAASYQNEINRNAQALLLSTQPTTNKTNLGLDFFAGLRLGKTLGKRTELFVMPAMRLNPGGYEVKNNLFNKKIQQAGISFGLSYMIN